MISSKKRYSSLFRVVAHEDRDEERQDEDGTEQVEDDEEHAVAPTIEVLRLCVDASNGHACEQNICPAFLRHNLEEDEQRVPKVVEIVVRVGSLAWCQNVPVERRAVVLSNTVFEVG